MSRCYNCSENFGIFKRPVTCGNCNFAFCSKCCNEKINVPKKENKLLVVCSKCKNVIKNGDKNETSDDTLPKNFLKLVETNRSKTNTASANVASNQAPNQGGYQDLANRLEILKNTDKPAVIPSDKEMEERLLKLTFGNNPPQQRSQLSNLPVEDKIKTSDDLISKLKDEAELDKKYEEYEKSELERLENRLRKLDAGTEKKSDPIIPDKGGEAKKSVIDTDIDLDDDEKTEKLVEQLLKEIKVNDDDEDAWCCMCNKDADLRCIDCENDFYCNKCFKKIHVAFEYKTHRKEAIKK